jgi:hypothetical protein
MLQWDSKRRKRSARDQETWSKEKKQNGIETDTRHTSMEVDLYLDPGVPNTDGAPIKKKKITKTQIRNR